MATIVDRRSGAVVPLTPKLGGEWVRDTLETTPGTRGGVGLVRAGTADADPALVRGGARGTDDAAAASPLPPDQRQTFAGAEETLGFRITPEVTLRASYRARRLFSQTDFSHQAMASVVWARRWF